jgi:hypothetical protein
MSQLLLQVLIVVALGAFCFGCGYLTGFIVTRNHWRAAGAIAWWRLIQSRGSRDFNVRASEVSDTIRLHFVH